MDSTVGLSEMSSSLETLLASGGDSRANINPSIGSNRYHCTTTPRPRLIPFGSCTASTISRRGYGGAKDTLNRLRAVGDGPDRSEAIEESFRMIRADLRNMLTRGQVPNLGVLLTPSGTDAEMFASLLAATGHTKRICNIVVGAHELGTGTVLAAGCRHFDVQTPAGRRVELGSPIDPDLANRIDVVELLLRESEGQARAPQDIDAEVTALVEKRIAQGERVLLHVTAHSKTGAHAPSLGVVEKLRDRYMNDIDVVVDAAQGRFSRRGLLRIVQLGYLVIVTGSKFYGGPPFSGALIIPEAYRGRIDALSALPAGFDQFLTPAQLPTSWKRLRASLPAWDNLGLLLRWSAAIEEMRGYYAIPSNLRLAVLRAFEAMVPEIFGDSHELHIDAVSPPIISNDYDRLLQSKTTVFTFRIWSDARAKYFSRQELKTIYDWMDKDFAQAFPRAPQSVRRATGSLFQIGQPVYLGNTTIGDVAGLRIANGGVLISMVAEDLTLGSSLDDRIGWLRDQLICLKQKLEMFARHYDQLANSMAKAT